MQEIILDILYKQEGKVYSFQELYKEVNIIQPCTMVDFNIALQQLINQVDILETKKQEYGSLITFGCIKGIIDIKEAGFGFVDTNNDKENGIFVPRTELGSAINNDEVLIQMVHDNEHRDYGKVIRVIKRNTMELIGELLSWRGRFILKPTNEKIDLLIFVDPLSCKRSDLHHIVKAKMTRFCDNHTADCKVIQVFDKADSVGMDITSLVLSSDVTFEFSSDGALQAKSLETSIDSNALLKQNNKLRDLRSLSIITIDGDDSKDFDDAIHIEKCLNGNYKLGVYIADVSHYVKEGDALDKDAFERGTSIYLPDRVIPMLPKELSNGICSLNEGCDRLVMAVEMEIDDKGMVVSSEIFEGIIKSSHRMTYSNVNKIVEENDETLSCRYGDIVPMLKYGEELYKILYNMRIKRGAFEFETTEAKLELDNLGNVTSISLRESRTAEKMIEEFMLIANEEVAITMTALNCPFLYRVHEEPSEEKLTRLFAMLDGFGYDIKIKGKKHLAKALQQLLLDSTNDTNETEDDKLRRMILNQTMIRSMMKAKYQEVNIGHFGLASSCYTHFTSPIRRYPDLLVQRLIKQFLFYSEEKKFKDPILFYNKKVHDAGIQSSNKERVSETLERDCDKLKLVQYMSKFINCEFIGVISSITNFGLFITLENTVDGLVRFDSLKDDYYEVDDAFIRVTGERYHKTYTLGQEVRVRLVDIDEVHHTIDFKMLGKI